VTSLASALLRMILTACFEAHTLCDRATPVNQTAQSLAADANSALHYSLA